MLVPDLEIRGGRGGGGDLYPPKFFGPSGLRFGLTIRVEGGGGVAPLDSPLERYTNSSPHWTVIFADEMGHTVEIQ